MPIPKDKRIYVSTVENYENIWDFSLNIDKDPNKLSIWSHLYAYFICPECKMSWKSIIRDAIRYKGKCSECRKKQTLVNKRLRNIEKGKSLEENFPELLKEWDYEENFKRNLVPSKVRAFSNYKALWKCKSCGQRYETIISNRTRLNSACPYCAGQKAIDGENDFATEYPQLLDEWDYETNNLKKIYPNSYKSGSHKVVNWICPLGHHYKKEIRLRVAGKMCPICSEESHTSFPEQVVYYYVKKYFCNTINRYQYAGEHEIDVYIPEKNIGLEYDGIYYHSSESQRNSDKDKELFLVNNGISLYRIIEVDKESFRIEGNNFYIPLSSSYKFLEKALIIFLEGLGVIKPDISVKRDSNEVYKQYLSIQKENSIFGYSEIMKTWDYENNDGIDPKLVSYGSNKNFYWKCLAGHSYLMSVKARRRGDGCPYCAGKKVLKGFNDLKSYAMKNNPKLLEIWDYDKNQEDIEDVYYNGNKKFWWICKSCKRKYLQSLYNKNNGRGCLYCAHKLVDKSDSFGTKHPELLEEWDYDKNVIDPFMVLEFSNKRVHWICKKCKRGYVSSIGARTSGSGCSKCKIDLIREKSIATKVLHKGSLIATKPKLVEEWLYEKNDLLGIRPVSVTSGSGKRVWWKCSNCAYEWEDIINLRSRGKRCPKCRFTYYPKITKK